MDNPHNFSWTYDSLADEVHIYFDLEGVRHHIEHDVARCSCAKAKEIPLEERRAIDKPLPWDE